MKNFCRDSRFQVAHYIANLLFNKFRFWGSRKLARFISFLLLGRYKTDTVCHTIYRFKLKVNPNFGKDIYYLGFYEVGTIHVINNVLRQGDTFMDVGSSVGLLSFIASNIVRETGQVFSFEPEESSFKHLVDNISINKSKNIKPFNVGLGNENQVIRIYKNRGCPSMVKEEETKLVENVKIVKLDELIESENIKKVKLIKIDVEGFELEVLKGAKNLLDTFDAPIICIEYFPNRKIFSGESSEVLKYILNVNTYSLFILKETKNTISKLVKIYSIEEIQRPDNIFCFLPSHFSIVNPDIFA